MNSVNMFSCWEMYSILCRLFVQSSLLSFDRSKPSTNSAVGRTAVSICWCDKGGDQSQVISLETPVFITRTV